jgi:hypothetical protein
MLTQEVDLVVGVGDEVEIGGVVLTVVAVEGGEVLVTVSRSVPSGDDCPGGR